MLFPSLKFYVWCGFFFFFLLMENLKNEHNLSVISRKTIPVVGRSGKVVQNEIKLPQHNLDLSVYYRNLLYPRGLGRPL